MKWLKKGDLKNVKVGIPYDAPMVIGLDGISKPLGDCDDGGFNMGPDADCDAGDVNIDTSKGKPDEGV
jgi:hypothetical protein